MNTENAIRVTNLSKKYSLGKKKDGSLRVTLASLFKIRKTKQEYFHALKNISFSIRKGDVVGIIGKNGAGKSTLLKLLSQITSPSEGQIEINGRIASLLEVGTGFHPELTGRENIFLNGTILGMTRKEVNRKFDEIVAFSGIEQFIDTPVKNYSSGMYVRLAFAVAAHLEPEILVIDEVLAVGDAEFQQKCLGKMKDIAGQGRTVLFVSHNMSAVLNLCNKGILIERGEVVFNGTILETVEKYQSSSFQTGNKKTFPNDSSNGNQFIKLLEISIRSLKSSLLVISEELEISIAFLNKIEGINLDCTIEIRNAAEVVVFHTGAFVSSQSNSKVGRFNIRFNLPAFYLNSDSYIMNLIFGENQREVLFQIDNCFAFRIENDTPLGNNFSQLPGVLRPNFDFKIDFNLYDEKA